MTFSQIAVRLNTERRKPNDSTRGNEPKEDLERELTGTRLLRPSIGKWQEGPALGVLELALSSIKSLGAPK